jgi:hypothetical protein
MLHLLTIADAIDVTRHLSLVIRLDVTPLFFQHSKELTSRWLVFVYWGNM